MNAGPVPRLVLVVGGGGNSGKHPQGKREVASRPQGSARAGCGRRWVKVA